MVKTENQKQKILILQQILEQKSDDEHCLSSSMLISELEKYGIAAERKSIYNDIEALRAFGTDVERKGGRHGGYYIAERAFELPELKLLVDAVQVCRFITANKSDKLIKKLEKLCSQYQAHKLQGRVCVNNRVKSPNESIFMNIDTLQEALNNNMQVRFEYYEWAVDFKKREPVYQKLKNNGQKYLVNPQGLLWNDEKYYLVASVLPDMSIRHFRVDKMKAIELIEQKCEHCDFEMNTYLMQHFNMMGGLQQTVRLRVNTLFAGVIIEHFGKDNLLLMPVDENSFECSVAVSVSEQFFGWLAGLGGNVQLIAPEVTRLAMLEHLKKLMEQYEDEVKA